MRPEGFFYDAFQVLHTFRRDCTLCDVALLARGSELPLQAHRVILSAQSAYFRAMFTSGMIEQQQREIALEGIESTALSKIVDFCYTGEVMLSPNDVEDLLDASHMLGIEQLQKICFGFLRNNMDSSNCYGIAQLADKYSCIEVRKIAEDFALRNFRQLMSSPDFTSLTLENLTHLVSHNKLKVACESEVIAAILKWVKHRPEERKKNLKDLLAHVRFPFLARKFLVDFVMKEELILGDRDCREYLYRALDYHLLPERRSLTQSALCTRRSNRPAGIYVIGGENRTGPLASTEVFDLGYQTWRRCADMKVARKHPAVATVGGRIYCIGGIDHDGNEQVVAERYDPAYNQWTLVASPNKCRGALAVAVLHGWLYAAGGSHGGTTLKYVERYDPTTDDWTFVQHMRVPRSNFGIGVLGAQLYAVGGHSGAGEIEQCEMYDALANTWKDVADLNKARRNHGVAVHGDRIFAVGGCGNAGILDCIEKYNMSLNLWLIIKHTLDPRAGCSACVAESDNDEHSLYILGGLDASHCCHSSVKRVNLRSIDYTIGSGKAMQEPRAHGGAVSL